MQSLPKPRLGDMLVTAGVLTEKNLQWALDQQKLNYKRLGEILLEAELASEDDIAEARALQLEMPFVELDDVAGFGNVASLVPEAIARTYNVLPIAVSGDRLAVATANPTDVEAIDAVQRYSKKRVEPILASESKLQKTLDQVYGTFDSADITASIEQAIEDVELGTDYTDADTDLAEERRQSGQAPVVKTVNLVLQEAVKQHASDIHFEPRSRSLEIRYRIDGALSQVRNLPKQIQAAVVSRIKIMAEMDIAEKRKPQDGRIAIKIHGKNIDLRISTMPVHYGERVVMRILDKNTQLFTVDKLGFGEGELSLFKRLLQKPYGIILVTGPTGSGKTTTLYAALSHIKSPDINIMTCEDPIEYELDGVNQSAVNVRAGLTFAAQLRSILRQDPDVVFVGEIRDSETATIAFQAAMTGHLVFSTLHCNDAPSAITRLTDMGIEPFLIGSSIVGVLAQRLVRSLCPKCKAPYEASPEELIEMGFDPDKDRVELQRAVGCPQCGGRGYTGRLAVYEIMPIGEDIRRLALRSPSADQVREMAVAGGMRSMRDHAMDKVLAGLTTLEEVRKRVLISDFTS
jgi:type IV pilus assembly protein PilB